MTAVLQILLLFYFCRDLVWLCLWINSSKPQHSLGHLVSSGGVQFHQQPWTATTRYLTGPHFGVRSGMVFYRMQDWDAISAPSQKQKPWIGQDLKTLKPPVKISLNPLVEVDISGQSVKGFGKTKDPVTLYVKYKMLVLESLILWTVMSCAGIVNYQSWWVIIRMLSYCWTL